MTRTIALFFLLIFLSPASFVSAANRFGIQAGYCIPNMNNSRAWISNVSNMNTSSNSMTCTLRYMREWDYWFSDLGLGMKLVDAHYSWTDSYQKPAENRITFYSIDLPMTTGVRLKIGSVVLRGYTGLVPGTEALYHGRQDIRGMLLAERSGISLGYKTHLGEWALDIVYDFPLANYEYLAYWRDVLHFNIGVLF